MNCGDVFKFEREERVQLLAGRTTTSRTTLSALLAVRGSHHVLVASIDFLSKRMLGLGDDTPIVHHELILGESS
jgi:hypothetical protein